MNFWLLMLILLIFHGVEFSPKGIHQDYISREQSYAMRGVFTLLITMTHFIHYFPYQEPGNEQFVLVWTFLEQLVVVVYLFFNGYGTVLSVNKKGWPYARDLLLHKIPGTWLRYALITLLTLLIHAFLQLQYTPGSILMTFTTWINFYYDDQWYVFMLLAMYGLMFLAYLPLKFTGRKNRRMMALCTLLACGLCCGLIGFVAWKGKGTYWYSSMPAMMIGMLWALFHEPIEKLFNRSSALYGLSLFACAMGMFIFRIHQNESILNLLVLTTVFTFSMLLVAMKVKTTNPILKFYGKHSFSIYLTMRIPMLILQRFELTFTQPAICMLFIFLCNAGVGMAMDTIGDGLTARVDRLIDGIVARLEVKKAA